MYDSSTLLLAPPRISSHSMDGSQSRLRLRTPSPWGRRRVHIRGRGIDVLQRLSRALVALVLASGSIGCATVELRDLGPEGIARFREPQRPLILIHGFMGSRLRDPDTERVAWGTLANVLLHGNRDTLALAIDDSEVLPGENLEPFEIFDGLLGVKYYGKTVRSFPEVGGYRLGDIDDPQPGDSAFVFLFDWRRDIDESARQLADAVDRVKQAVSAKEVDLLAHSLGGLVGRYYVKYGRTALTDRGPLPVPSMEGAASIRNLVLLGTPNFGCMEALKALHVGIRKGVRPIRPEAAFTMPALYQMLPTRESARFVDPDGNRLDLNLYDPATWVEREWSMFSPPAQERMRKKILAEGGGEAEMKERNRRLLRFLELSLARAKRMQAALAEPAAPDGKVSYHAFGSDCRATLVGALVIDEPGGRDLRFNLHGVRDRERREMLTALLYEWGDGAVSIRSLLTIRHDGDATAALEPPLDSAFFVCRRHGVLGNDPIFQKNLFFTLLWDADAPLVSTAPDPQAPAAATGPKP